MKPNLRKTMKKMVSEACEALPGADKLINGSQTRAATALTGLLIAAIQRVCQNNPGSTHPIDLARRTVFHDGFRKAFAQLPRIFTPDEVYPPHKRFIAGMPVSYAADVQVCNWGSFQLSYAEDMLTTSKDRSPCAKRICDILALFRAEMFAHNPTADPEIIRCITDAGGNKYIVFPGLNEVFVPAIISININTRNFAHSRINACFRHEISRTFTEQKQRALYIDNMIEYAQKIEIEVKTALERIAPELQLQIQRVETKHRGLDIIAIIIYEGLGFDFQKAEIRSEMRQGLERYIKHSLPGIVHAQRLLQMRMPTQDPANVLIEAPLVRHMMEQFGSDWLAEAKTIIAFPDGKKYKTAKWKARLSQGILRGSMKLSSQVEWRSGELLVEAGLSDSAIAGLPGKLLSEVVEHPYFGPETRIIAASGKTRYRKNDAGQYMPYALLVLRTNVPDQRLNDFLEPLAKAA